MMEQPILNNTSYNALLDAVELQMHTNGLVDVPIVHRFSPGVYTRSMVDVPVGTYLLSHTHRDAHQFIMSKGKIVIYTRKGMKVLSAPYIGDTESGTRRFAKVLEPVTWTSIHATSIAPENKSPKAIEKAIKLVEAELYEKHQNIFLVKEGGKSCPV